MQNEQLDIGPEIVNNKKKQLPYRMLILLGVAVLVFGVVAGVFAFNRFIQFSSKSNSDNSNGPIIAVDKQIVTDKSVLYGYWSDKKSVIELANLTTGNSSTIAILPYDIKHISFAQPNSIVFISGTDKKDYGSSLVMRDLQDEKITTIKDADNGFGIDDYVLSRDNAYVATWEISLPPGQTALVGGKSKVYRVNVLTKQTELIYNEDIRPGIPIHYPLAVKTDGDLIVDTFSPNSGAGWAHGISIVRSDGKKVDISKMKNGTYSSQPVLSEDESKLLFVGYDDSQGNGAELVNGFRRAFLYPNTIEIYELELDKRYVVTDPSSGDIFSNVQWEGNNGGVYYSLASTDVSRNGHYQVRQGDKLPTKISNVNADYIYKTTVANEIFLFGRQTTDISGLGNLSKKYEPVYTSMILVDANNSKVSQVPFGGKTIQVISTLKSDLFADIIKNSKTENGQQLQLSTFVLKPKLAPARQEQQSEGETPPQPTYPPSENVPYTPAPTLPPSSPNAPRCYELAAEQCNAMLGTDYSTSRDDRYKAERFDAFNKCRIAQEYQNKLAGACSDSPLYLYGPVGAKITVHSGVPIFNANVPYSPESGFIAEILSDGKIKVGGKRVHSISFDYQTGQDMAMPSYGYYVNKDEIKKVFGDFGDILGLNEMELFDTISKAKELVGDGAFVSFYDDKTSKNILPLFFSPQPDNYYNIVFYIKPLSATFQRKTIGKLPDIKKIKRNGITAVEISFVVE